MTDEYDRLRAAGRAVAAGLPQLSPECCRRIAELLREPINQFVTAQRRCERGGVDGAA